MSCMTCWKVSQWLMELHYPSVAKLCTTHQFSLVANGGRSLSLTFLTKMLAKNRWWSCPAHSKCALNGGSCQWIGYSDVPIYSHLHWRCYQWHNVHDLHCWNQEVFRSRWNCGRHSCKRRVQWARRTGHHKPHLVKTLSSADGLGEKPVVTPKLGKYLLDELLMEIVIPP